MDYIFNHDSQLDSLYHREWDERSEVDDGQDEDCVEEDGDDRTIRFL